MAEANPFRLMFVTWDGPTTNYLESLFIPILSAVQAEEPVRFHVLQYHWASNQRTDQTRALAKAKQIEYCGINVGSTVGERIVRLGQARRHLFKAINASGVDALMPRSIIPAALSLPLFRRLKPALVYDADGLKADERVEFSAWPQRGVRYRTLQSIEHTAVRRSTLVTTRTHATVDILRNRVPEASREKFYVIRNGVDSSTFVPRDDVDRRTARRELSLPENVPVVVYVGSHGPQYEPGALFRFFRAVLKLRPEARLLVMSGSPERFEEDAIESGLQDKCTIFRAQPTDVARLLCAGDLAVAFRTPSLSQRAVAPIKIGEYLLCGLPVLATLGIGDLDQTLAHTSGVRLLADLGEQSLARAADWFANEVLRERVQLRSTARRTGEDHFSLDCAVADWQIVLQRLRKGEG